MQAGGGRRLGAVPGPRRWGWSGPGEPPQPQPPFPLCALRGAPRLGAVAQAPRAAPAARADPSLGSFPLTLIAAYL